VAATLAVFTLMAAATAEDPQMSDPSHAVQRHADQGAAQDVDELHVLGAFFNPDGQQNSPEEVEYQRPAAKTGKTTTAFVAAQNGFRHRRSMGPRRPGYVKRCVVTASMHRKWAAAHQRWLRARKAWAAAKRRFRFERSKRSERRKKWRARRSRKRTRRSWRRKTVRRKHRVGRERKWKQARLRMRHREKANKLRKEILRNVRARRKASRKARANSTERTRKRRLWATSKLRARKRMNERRIKHVRRYRAKRERMHKFRMARLRMRHRERRTKHYRRHHHARAKRERMHKFRMARLRMRHRERRMKIYRRLRSRRSRRSRRMSLVQIPHSKWARKRRFVRRAIRARNLARKARGGRSRVRPNMRAAIRARERARKARHMQHWRRFHGKQRRKLVAADNKARALRHAAREARQKTSKRNPNEMFNKMNYAREIARKARTGLTRERSQKKIGRMRRGGNRCLKWIWWPHSKVARKDWYKNKKYSDAVTAARNAWRAAHGFNASTPNVEGGKTKPTNIGKEIWKANRGFISMTHARNVLNLKAYCVASHQKMVTARKGNGQLSSLGTFLYRFGVKKKSRNAFGEYTALVKTYTRFYTRGLGLYMLRMMKAAMRRPNGILVWSRKKTSMLLNHKRLGLRGEPKAFRKWGVTKNQYKAAVKQVRRLNSTLWNAVKSRASFKKSTCKCTSTQKWPKYSTCRKHFKYDSKPWCQVAKVCPGSSHSRQGFKWRYC